MECCSCTEPDPFNYYKRSGKEPDGCSKCGKPLPKKEYPISACCNASVHTDMSPDFPGDDPKKMREGTCCYICDACGKPCDLAEWNKPKKEEECPEPIFICHYAERIKLKQYPEPKPQVPSELILHFSGESAIDQIENKINEILKFLREGK